MKGSGRKLLIQVPRINFMAPLALLFQQFSFASQRDISNSQRVEQLKEANWQLWNKGIPGDTYRERCICVLFIKEESENTQNIPHILKTTLLVCKDRIDGPKADFGD